MKFLCRYRRDPLSLFLKESCRLVFGSSSFQLFFLSFLLSQILQPSRPLAVKFYFRPQFLGKLDIHCSYKHFFLLSHDAVSASFLSICVAVSFSSIPNSFDDGSVQFHGLIPYFGLSNPPPCFPVFSFPDSILPILLFLLGINVFLSLVHRAHVRLNFLWRPDLGQWHIPFAYLQELDWRQDRDHVRPNNQT